MAPAIESALAVFAQHIELEGPSTETGIGPTFGTGFWAVAAHPNPARSTHDCTDVRLAHRRPVPQIRVSKSVGVAFIVLSGAQASKEYFYEIAPRTLS